MSHLKYVILLLCLVSILHSSERAHFVVESSLRDPAILNIPPLKIEGFILGSLKSTAIKQLKKKYRANQITVKTLANTSPQITIYKVLTANAENYAFYFYENILAKIFVVNIRPFEKPQVIIKRLVYKYGPARELTGRPRRYAEQGGYYWKKYIWNRKYRYKPEFAYKRLYADLKITLDLSLKYSHVRRVTYGYFYTFDFLKRIFPNLQ